MSKCSKDSDLSKTINFNPTVLAQLAFEVFCAFLGTYVLASAVPWEAVFLPTIPAGGDNPSHPVLMRDVGAAFMQHGSIVNYSYSFWSGFELFQFYFPLPYLAGAILGEVINPFVAFKLTTILGLLLLPPAFYLMGRFLNFSIFIAAGASLAATGFLSTEAHVMWGGNIYSALAGMIGNSWAFVFFTIGFGSILRLHSTGKGAVLTSLCIVGAALSHFYAALMLGVLFGVVCALDVAFLVIRRKLLCANFSRLYGSGIIAGLLLAWWLIPLVYYHRYSSDFGGNWQVVLTETFTRSERIGFLAALIIAPIYMLLKRSFDFALVTILLFGSCFISAFYLNDYLHSTAFINIRLWPSIFFSGYALTLVTLDRLSKLLPSAVSPVLIALLFPFAPGEAALTKSKSWMEWNFSGLEAKTGFKDFKDIVGKLQELPAGRVSFESNDQNNGTFGSVRAFEMLPLFTKHTIVEGGILNSALLPGVGYTLQCLTSKSCAGWPAGSVMPGHDLERSISLMRDLGVSYHIAVDAELTAEYSSRPEFDKLYSGKFASLFALKSTSSLVEVYDSPPPIISSSWPHPWILNLPRWDRIRETAFVFKSPLNESIPDGSNPLNTAALFNLLASEWRLGARVNHDLGWAPPDPNSNEKHLNAYIFHPHPKPNHVGYDDSTFFIADRGFDPDVYVPNLQQSAESKLVLPLARSEKGVSSIRLAGKGYFASLGNTDLELNRALELNFEGPDDFKSIEFSVDKREQFRYIDAITTDTLLENRMAGTGDLVLPKKITEQCSPTVVNDFHSISLHTNCPGKPHILKFSYYPKWHAEDHTISLSNHGYMLVTPKGSDLILTHSWGFPDILGVVLSILGLGMLIKGTLPFSQVRNG